MKSNSSVLDELVEAIRFLHAQGWAPATSSNYSVQLPDQRLFISASGIDKGAFGREHLMQIDPEGHPVDDPRKPSAETGLHVMLYDLFPETGCILHTHTIYNTILSRHHLPEGKLVLEGYEVLKGIAGHHSHQTTVEVPVFDNSQDIPALALEIRPYLVQNPTCKGFLLAGHGLYTWGASVAEAKRHIEVFEFLFECSYKLRLYQNAF